MNFMYSHHIIFTSYFTIKSWKEIAHINLTNEKLRKCFCSYVYWSLCGFPDYSNLCRCWLFQVTGLALLHRKITQKVVGTGNNIHDPIVWNRNRDRNISLIIGWEEFEWRNPTSFKSPFFFTGIKMNKCIFKHGGF